MTSEKGKGKAITPSGSDGNENPQQNEDDETQEQSSFTNRLGSSAAQLSRSLFTGGPEATDISRLASSTSSKGGASATTAPKVSGESSYTTSNIHQGAINNNQPVFRSRPFDEADEHAARAEADFSTFLDGTSVSVPSVPKILESSWIATIPSEPIDSRNSNSGLAIHSVSIAEQEARDGAQVVDLLSQHGVDEMDADFESQPSREDIAKLRRALFGSDSSGNETLPQTWDNVLNFIPDFVRPDPGAVPGAVNNFKSTESEALLGLTHGPEAESLWVEQWMDVLTRYNNEVWGDLGSLVEQAKEELKQLDEAKPEDGSPVPKAIRRLQQILGHLLMSSPPPRPAGRPDFEIAILCALPVEADAVLSLFDEDWDENADGRPYGKAIGDPNAYTTGLVGRHNVVLAHLGGMGNVSSASAATSFRWSFPNIKLAFIVGILGVVPFDPKETGMTRKTERVFGDIIVSEGVVQYDFDRQYSDKFVVKDTLRDAYGRPNLEIRALLAKLKSKTYRKRIQQKIAEYLESLKIEDGLEYKYPGKRFSFIRTARNLGIGEFRIGDSTGNAKGGDQKPRTHFSA
ncbi:hypothetical protein PspLS_08284 [Pyricularia sp. CBS 133598]|nr:hypothetical protein PspLS_08284 [Pyricularia sp. CBS 133598]